MRIGERLVNMGFFDRAIKNIVKKAKPILPVAAMFAAPYLAPKLGAFLGAGSRRVPMAAWAMGRVNSFLRGSRKHDLDLRKKRRKK